MEIFFRSCRDLLQHPLKIFVIAGVLATTVVVLDGALFRIWSLNRDHERLAARIESLKVSVKDKELRLLEASRPEFIERQVREQLDFVRDGDLVFVFSDTPQFSPASEKASR